MRGQSLLLFLLRTEIVKIITQVCVTIAWNPVSMSTRSEMTPVTDTLHEYVAWAPLLIS